MWIAGATLVVLRLVACLITLILLKWGRGFVVVFFEKIHQSIATHIFIGGSTDVDNQTDNVVSEIKKTTNLPVVIFPGDVSQISQKADAILFLSLLSGRNPEYLIEQQIKAVPLLKKSNLEILPTGYILIDGKKTTATQRVSNTKPISQENKELILNTALAGQFSGKKSHESGVLEIL